MFAAEGSKSQKGIARGKPVAVRWIHGFNGWFVVKPMVDGVMVDNDGDKSECNHDQLISVDG